MENPEALIRTLVSCVSKGGNLIMNVGPTAKGYFDVRADKALKVYEEWMKYNGESIYNCTMAEPEFTAPLGTLLTQSVDEKRLFIHLVDYPFDEILLKDVAGKIDYAQFLHDNSEIHFIENADGSVTIVVPGIKPDLTIPVIDLILK